MLKTYRTAQLQMGIETHNLLGREELRSKRQGFKKRFSAYPRRCPLFGKEGPTLPGWPIIGEEKDEKI